MLLSLRPHRGSLGEICSVATSPESTRLAAAIPTTAQTSTAFTAAAKPVVTRTIAATTADASTTVQSG